MNALVFGPGRVCVPVLAALLCGCVYLSRHTLPGACANDLGSPIRNFCVVRPRVLWRAEGPSRADARWLLEHRVGSIVTLGTDARQAFESVRLAPGLERSVTYYHVRFSVLQLITHRHLDRHVATVLAIIRKAPKPVLISCKAGVDRTGIIAAAYRVLAQGWTRKQAIAEMDGFHSPWDPLNARYVRSLSPERRAAILQDLRTRESRIEPSGRFACRNGGCRFIARR